MASIRSLILYTATMFMSVVYAQGNSFSLYGESCVQNEVTLGCVLDSFTLPLTLSRTGLAPVSCAPGGCSRLTATINGNIYAFTSNSSGSYISFNMTDGDYHIEWTCNYNSTDLKYTVSEACGHETTTEEQTSMTEQPKKESSFMSTESSYSTMIGSGKDSRETISITSTDNQTNASIATEQINVLAPLVVTISVVGFCLFVITFVTIFVVYTKRHANHQNPADKYSDITQSPNERSDYENKGASDPNRKDVNENNFSFQTHSEYNFKGSSIKHSHSTRDKQQQGRRYENNNLRLYKGAIRRGQSFEDYLPRAYYRTTQNGFSRQPREMNFQSDFTVYHGHNRRGILNFQGPYYSYPNNRF